MTLPTKCAKVLSVECYDEIKYVPMLLSRELPAGARQIRGGVPITVPSCTPNPHGAVGGAGCARYSAADMIVSHKAAQAAN